MPRHARRAVAAIASAALLIAGCTTRQQRLGFDDGTDPCRTQLVALDSTGNFFAEDIIRGAAIGAVAGGLIGGLASGNWRGAAIGAGVGAVAGAAGGYLAALQRQHADQQSLVRNLTNDIDRENLQIDRSQVAFNQLVDCRYLTAQRIRENYRAGRVDRATAQAQLADVQNRMRRDVQLAQTINTRITGRGTEFDTAMESVQPGVKQQVAGARVTQPVPATSRVASVALKLRPDGGSPEVAQISSRDSVTVRPATDGYVLVEGPGGVRGYAPAEQFNARGVNLRAASAAPPPTPTAAAPGDVRTLAASNIARRDNFSESVTNAQQVAEGQAFELAG